MIYKAAPIRAHRLEVSAAQNTFIPTNDFAFGSRPSDLRVLSYFNENQSIMGHYSGGNSSSFSTNTQIPYTSFATPFMTSQHPAEFQQASGMVHVPDSSGYDPSYARSDISASTFEPPMRVCEAPSPEIGYSPFIGGLPSSPPYYHPPMLLPPQYYASPPASSPVSTTSPGRSPQKQELQIRMSQPCYEMGQRHHEIIPLETGPFKK